MIDIYCDAYLCACPNLKDGPDRFQEFIEGILLLRELPRLSWIRFCVSRCTIEALCAAGQYPIRPHVERSVAAFQRGDIDPRDVVAIIDRLLSKEPCLEDRAGLHDFLYDKLQVAPSYRLHREPLLADAFERHLILATFRYAGKETTNTHDLIATTGVDLAGNRIRVEAVLVCAEGDVTFSLPINIVGDFGLLQSWTELCEWISTEHAWIACQSVDDFAAVVHIHIEKAAKILPPESGTRLRWRFGDQFLRTAAELRFDNDLGRVRCLLRACSEVVLRQNMTATHELRKGEGPNSPQIVRGGAGAWRRDIDYDFHLHYWSDGNMVEFASVVVHSDMSIS